MCMRIGYSQRTGLFSLRHNLQCVLPVRICLLVLAFAFCSFCHFLSKNLALPREILGNRKCSSKQFPLVIQVHAPSHLKTRKNSTHCQCNPSTEQTLSTFSQNYTYCCIIFPDLEISPVYISQVKKKDLALFTKSSVSQYSASKQSQYIQRQNRGIKTTLLIASYLPSIQYLVFHFFFPLIRGILSLPLDIIINILCFLPAKTLAHFKCV